MNCSDNQLENGVALRRVMMRPSRFYTQATGSELLVQTPQRVVECSSELVIDTEISTQRATCFAVRCIRHTVCSAYRTWSPKLDDVHAYVVVEYAHEVYASNVCVFETWNAGAVASIAVRAPNGDWHDVFETTRVEALHRARISRGPRSRRTRCASNSTRLLRVAMTTCGTYCQQRSASTR